MAKSTKTWTSGSRRERIRSYFRITSRFRLLQALLFITLALELLPSPPLQGLERPLALGTAFSHLAITLFAFWYTARRRVPVRLVVAALVVVDLGAGFMMMSAIPAWRTGIQALMGINIAEAALILSLRGSLASAAVGTLAVIGQTLFVALRDDRSTAAQLIESSSFGVIFFAVAVFCYVIARQLQASEALARQRGVDLANLEQVNELVIRRMRTGVLLVDEGNQIHLMNESAWLLLDSPAATERDLGQLAPELSRRLYHWRTTSKLDETSVALADGVPEVVPRFTRLSASDDDSHMLIFLDDTSLVSRRAEELTLTSLGRLSASIAHEIRNPLAAIRYSAQLLAESEELDEADQRMIEIINNNCRRLNEIIEDILQLSRRERSRPETIDFSRWVSEFVDEYENSNDLGNDSLRAMVRDVRVTGVADPQQLQQVVWNLVQNALRYGRLPDEPARVTLIARQDGAGLPLLEVIDRGPGIPHKVAARIFEPFYTTHELGTGLGLYLARQMCEANQASLEYVPVPGGGSCFRITLSPASHAPAGS